MMVGKEFNTKFDPIDKESFFSIQEALNRFNLPEKYIFYEVDGRKLFIVRDELGRAQGLMSYIVTKEKCNNGEFAKYGIEFDLEGYFIKQVNQGIKDLDAFLANS